MKKIETILEDINQDILTDKQELSEQDISDQIYI